MVPGRVAGVSVAPVQRVHGVVQRYAWGDPVFIPSLLGVEPDGEPWAELWIGTHPSGPATLDDGRPLRDLTGELPYLLKVLAAAEPLSLQLHPDAEQARDGFERGVYPDPNAKPELLCALTEFDALCGIRPVEATLALLDELGLAGVGSCLADVLASDGPRGVLTALYTGTIDVEPVVDACATSDRDEAGWVGRLAERYPDDPSVVAHVAVEPRPPVPRRGAPPRARQPARLPARRGDRVDGPERQRRARRADAQVGRRRRVAAHRRHHTTRRTEDRRSDGYRLNDDVQLVRLEAGDIHRAVGHEVSIDLSGEAWYLPPGDERLVTVSTYIVTS